MNRIKEKDSNPAFSYETKNFLIEEGIEHVQRWFDFCGQNQATEMQEILKTKHTDAPCDDVEEHKSEHGHDMACALICTDEIEKKRQATVAKMQQK